MKRLVIALIALVLALATGFAPRQAVQAAPDWLDYVNAIRALANLPAVTEDPALSAGALNHATYVVMNNQIGHVEDPAAPGYTPDGAVAGQNGNVYGGGANATFKDAIDSWMGGPFHGIGILDPRLTRVGFGLFIDPNAQGVNAGATIDVISGRDFTVTPTFPVLYPADGKPLSILTYSGELPDPLIPCPGYTQPAGATISMQLADAPNVTASQITKDGAGAVDSCSYTGATYTHPDPAWQQLGQQILNVRNAVVIIPKAPLTPGTYHVSVTNNGTPITWSFTVGG